MEEEELRAVVQTWWEVDGMERMEKEGTAGTAGVRAAAAAVQSQGINTVTKRTLPRPGQDRMISARRLRLWERKAATKGNLSHAKSAR